MREDRTSSWAQAPKPESDSPCFPRPVQTVACRGQRWEQGDGRHHGERAAARSVLVASISVSSVKMG